MMGHLAIDEPVALKHLAHCSMKIHNIRNSIHEKSTDLILFE
jgi:hypothetical protein